MDATNQSRFLKAIEVEVALQKLDYRLETHYANTGRVYVFRNSSDFGKPVFSFGYAFNDGYAVFQDVPELHGSQRYLDGALATALSKICTEIRQAAAAVRMKLI